MNGLALKSSGQPTLQAARPQGGRSRDRRRGHTVGEVQDLRCRRSGLLGLSGVSGDLRDLEPAAAGSDPSAAIALDIQAYRVRKYVGAYAAALGGIDALVLSGALAEDWAILRRRALAGLELLGILFDDDRNRAAGPAAPACIGADNGRVQAGLVPADEERQIAREVFFDLLRGDGA